MGNRTDNDLGGLVGAVLCLLALWFVACCAVVGIAGFLGTDPMVTLAVAVAMAVGVRMFNSKGGT